MWIRLFQQFNRSTDVRYTTYIQTHACIHAHIVGYMLECVYLLNFVKNTVIPKTGQVRSSTIFQIKINLIRYMSFMRPNINLYQISGILNTIFK